MLTTQEHTCFRQRIDKLKTLVELLQIQLTDEQRTSEYLRQRNIRLRATNLVLERELNKALEVLNSATSRIKRLKEQLKKQMEKTLPARRKSLSNLRDPQNARRRLAKSKIELGLNIRQCWLVKQNVPLFLLKTAWLCDEFTGFLSVSTLILLSFLVDNG
jgi:hypothetical protein